MNSELKIEYLPVESLRPYERNARKHTRTDISKIAESIRRYGFNDPIGIWGPDCLIVEGEGRLLAAKRLEMSEVPCIRLDYLSEQDRREYAIVHNKTAEFSAWDEQMLRVELKTMDLSFFGFGLDPKEGVQAAEDCFNPSSPVEHRCKYGSLWSLGQNRLMCGDSTCESDVAVLVDGADIDLLLTDPPYGIDYKGAAGRVLNDDLTELELRDFLASAFENAERFMRPGACFYVFYSSVRGMAFMDALGSANMSLRQVLVWVKDHFTLGRTDFQNQYEPCLAGEKESPSDYDPALYGWKSGAAHTFRYDRKQSTVLEFPKPAKSSLHPTMKPVPLFDYLMKASTYPGDNVLDLFAGSGTAIIAGEQNGRRVFAMEADPACADVILARWENLTGHEAERIGYA